MTTNRFSGSSSSEGWQTAHNAHKRCGVIITETKKVSSRKSRLLTTELRLQPLLPPWRGYNCHADAQHSTLAVRICNSKRCTSVQPRERGWSGSTQAICERENNELHLCSCGKLLVKRGAWKKVRACTRASKQRRRSLYLPFSQKQYRAYFYSLCTTTCLASNAARPSWNPLAFPLRRLSRTCKCTVSPQLVVAFVLCVDMLSGRKKRAPLFIIILYFLFTLGALVVDQVDVAGEAELVATDDVVVAVIGPSGSTSSEIAVVEEIGSGRGGGTAKGATSDTEETKDGDDEAVTTKAAVVGPATAAAAAPPTLSASGSADGDEGGQVRCSVRPFLCTTTCMQAFVRTVFAFSYLETTPIHPSPTLACFALDLARCTFFAYFGESHPSSPFPPTATPSLFLFFFLFPFLILSPPSSLTHSLLSFPSFPPPFLRRPQSAAVYPCCLKPWLVTIRASLSASLHLRHLIATCTTYTSWETQPGRGRARAMLLRLQRCRETTSTPECLQLQPPQLHGSTTRRTVSSSRNGSTLCKSTMLSSFGRITGLVTTTSPANGATCTTKKLPCLELQSGQ